MQAKIGNHSFRLEGDILDGKLKGDLTEEDAHALFGLMRDVCFQYGPFFLLVDISGLGTINPAARGTIAKESARIAKVPGLIDCRGTAVYGATLPTRAVITLVIRALEMFRLATSPTRFLKNEQEARSYLDQLRTA